MGSKELVTTSKLNYQYQNKLLLESQFPGQRLGLSFWIGGTESRKLDHQKIPNTSKYLLVRTNTKASTCIQDPASPNCWQLTVQDASPKPQARQKHKPNHQQTRFPLTPQNIPLYTVRCKGPSKRKKNHLLQTESRNRSIPTQSLNKPLDQPYPQMAEIKWKKEYDPKA